MFMYNMHRDREFPMKTNNLAALFLGLFESPRSYTLFISSLRRDLLHMKTLTIMFVRSKLDLTTDASKDRRVYFVARERRFRL